MLGPWGIWSFTSWDTFLHHLDFTTPGGSAAVVLFFKINYLFIFIVQLQLSAFSPHTYILLFFKVTLYFGDSNFAQAIPLAYSALSTFFT